MLIKVEKEACVKKGLTLGGFFYLLFCNYSENFEEDIKILVQGGYITSAGCSGKYRVTNNGVSLLNDIMLNSDTDKNEDKVLEEIAIKLKEVFPQGRKRDTQLYWTEGVALIIKRLKLFKRKYNVDLDVDSVVSAAQNYVTGFNGDYKFMKTLKYFIFKEKKGEAGEIESESELLNYMENAGQTDVTDTQTTIDWDVELR